MNFEIAYDNFLNENNLTRCEGDRGVENLKKIAKLLGYRDEGYKYGDPISSFLSDNPGAIEAIHNWIRETALPEWAESLALETA